MVNVPTNKRVGDSTVQRHPGSVPSAKFELTTTSGQAQGAQETAGGATGLGGLQTLGQKLGELRRAKGMTQVAVAARMGTTQPSLARLEKNELNPNLKTLSRYAAAINYDVRVTYTPKSAGAGAGQLAESDLESVPNKLADLRKATGLTQAAVAERLNNTQPVVARLESGEVIPNLRTLERYADVIGMRIEMLFRESAK